VKRADIVLIPIPSSCSSLFLSNQVSYACRYPGQQSALLETASSGSKERVLSQEGKIWEAKVLSAEVMR
jgi:hypothetical protein